MEEREIQDLLDNLDNLQAPDLRDVVRMFLTEELKRYAIPKPGLIDIEPLRQIKRRSESVIKLLEKDESMFPSEVRAMYPDSHVYINHGHVTLRYKNQYGITKTENVSHLVYKFYHPSVSSLKHMRIEHLDDNKMNNKIDNLILKE